MIPFRLVKSLDIMYVVAIQFIVAILLNVIIDGVLERIGHLEEDNTKIVYTYSNFVKHLLIAILIISIFAIVSYFARLTIKHIPSPFNGISGFQHIRLKELQEVGSLTAFLFLTSNYLDSKIKTLREMYKKLIV
jgi:uncharacterized protein (DUF486 family)